MTPKKKAAVYARYTGNGYVEGVPAADMSRAEWFSLSDERKAFALEAGTHTIVKKSEEVVNDG